MSAIELDAYELEVIARALEDLREQAEERRQRWLQARSSDHTHKDNAQREAMASSCAVLAHFTRQLREKIRQAQELEQAQTRESPTP